MFHPLFQVVCYIFFVRTKTYLKKRLIHFLSRLQRETGYGKRVTGQGMGGLAGLLHRLMISARSVVHNARWKL